MKQTSIFRQLIYNIVLPVILALIVLGALNISNTRVMLREMRETRNYLISDELIQVLKFQELTLNIIEERLNPLLEEASSKAVNKFLVNTKGIERFDLHALRDSLGLDPKLYDLYIIDRSGIVVNTTFEKDLGLNFFSFGLDHEMYIRSIFEGGEFVNERFTIESSTRRLKKYTYEPTLNGEYIFELGVYSPDADTLINIIKGILNESSQKHPTIVSAELFMNADDPFSLTKTLPIEEAEKEFIMQRFREKDSVTVESKVNGRYLSTQYIYNESSDSRLYKGSVIRIVTDRTDEIREEWIKLLGFILFFGLVVMAIVLLIYRKTRVITNPIKKLVDNVNRISDGHLNERAEVVGTTEIATLSMRFNKMIAELEALYNDLDQKVKDRTAEVVAQKEELEIQRDLLAEQKSHILDSIHYSKRLQTAILPSNEFIRGLFPESFVLFMPKDIISGDFYWFHRNKHRHYFSAIDCTGHGVPGALVSMVGQNWLNYAVKDLKLEKPSEILDALNQGVISTFNEGNSDTSVKDGMDLSMCCINTKTLTLEFAGAYNPVTIIKPNGEIIHIKGDKFPIGAISRGERTPFTNHEIKLEKGDMIYSYSDGYPDQFGGPMGSKFMIKQFRNLLQEISKLQVDEQNETLRITLSNWMDKEEQVDDITIIGVRV